MKLFGSRNIQLSEKAHINKTNKKVHVIIFALLRAQAVKKGKGKILPEQVKTLSWVWQVSTQPESQSFFCAFFLLCFIYSCLSLTESSVLKVTFFWVSISLFSLKDWLQRADQNRGQVDNQRRISRKALACFKVFQLGACWGQRLH